MEFGRTNIIEFYWICLYETFAAQPPTLCKKLMRHESILMGRLKFIRPESPQCFGSPSEEKKIPKTKLGTLSKNSHVPQKRDYLTISIHLPTNHWFSGSISEFSGMYLPFLFASRCGCVTWAMTKRAPGWLGYIGDYTTQLYRDYNEPL